MTEASSHVDVGLLKERGFIDVHVHPPTKEFLIDAGGPNAEAAARKFGHTIELKTLEQMLEEYTEAGVDRLVLFAWDAETTSKRPRVPMNLWRRSLSNILRGF